MPFRFDDLFLPTLLALNGVIMLGCGWALWRKGRMPTEVTRAHGTEAPLARPARHDVPRQGPVLSSARLGVAILTVTSLLLPSGGAWLIYRKRGLDPYQDLATPGNPVISALLNGERLAPPASLPPAVFSDAATSAGREELAWADRDWQKLDPDFAQRLLALHALMRRHGYSLVLLEGYRSPERQTMLASLGSQVTRAGAYQSYHQYGLAADCAFLLNGKLVISERDDWAMEGYRLYGSYAEALGLVWGGRWQMRDFGHIELRKNQIRRSGARPPA